MAGDKAIFYQPRDSGRDSEGNTIAADVVQATDRTEQSLLAAASSTRARGRIVLLGFGYESVCRIYLVGNSTAGQFSVWRWRFSDSSDTPLFYFFHSSGGKKSFLIVLIFAVVLMFKSH